MGKLGAEEQALLARMQAGGFKPAHQIPIEISRAALTQMALAMAGPKVPIERVRDERIAGPAGDIAIRVYDQYPAERGSRGVALFFHGGGYYLGNLDTHDHVCRFLCAHAGVPVVAVDYRLAPEHKFPAGLEDCYAALEWVASHAAARGWDPTRIAVVGDSAGGTLATSVCRLARDRNGPAVAYQVAIYPGLTLDDANEFSSRREFGNGEYFLSSEDQRFFRELYLRDPEREVANPLVSPIRAPEFRGLPATLIVAAEFDPVRDECAHYAELLRHAGIPAEYVCFAGTIHPFFLFDGVLEAGRRGQALVAQRIGRAIGPRPAALERN